LLKLYQLVPELYLMFEALSDLVNGHFLLQAFLSHLRVVFSYLFVDQLLYLFTHLANLLNGSLQLLLGFVVVCHRSE